MTGEAQEALRAQLAALGFDEVRFAAVEPAPEAAALGEWLQQGLHADMEWMNRTAEKRADPELVLAGAKSVILLGVNYWRTQPAPEAGRPVWARYALHEDYHDTMKPALVAAGRLLETQFGLTGAQYRYYVDAGPVLERGWAARAGVGFLGKNAMLISRKHGNWLLLAAIFTPLDLRPDAPVRKTVVNDTTAGAVGLLCGKCTRCLDACPTQAFPRPGIVDARRCISYQTIENRGIIPRELRAGIGARIYGCDTCLAVCPWNRFAQEGRQMLLVARDELAALSLADILTLTPERYAAVFRRTPIKRVKLAGLLRNACIVAANTRAVKVRPLLVELARHASPVVRAHAVWAVFRLSAAPEAEALLADARAGETDRDVLAEYAAEAVRAQDSE
jgi:epoxyqueuosine reductase